MKTKVNTKSLVILGLMTALTMIFSFTPIGSIPIGPLVITLNVIPIAIAAVTVAGSGSDFEHVARDARRGGVVGQQRALENEIVRGFRRNALRGVNLRHVSGF